MPEKHSSPETKEKALNGERHRRERQLAELYQTIDGLRELVGKEAGRTWEHVSEEDVGEIGLAGKQPDIFDESDANLDLSEILFIAGKLIKKVLEKGGVKPLETFKSGDGKILVCEVDETGWSVKIRT